MNKLLVIILFGHFVAASAFAKTNRYMVFFADKEGTPYSLSEPGLYLTQRAIERRNRYKIPIQTNDLPVSPVYLNNLRTYGFEPYLTSRWFNGALIECSDSAARQLGNLQFVLNVELAALGPRFSGRDENGRLGGRSGYNSTSTQDVSLPTDLQNSMLGIDKMHEKGFKGEGMLVGVFDSGFTGVNSSPFFAGVVQEGRIAATRDFVGSSGNVYQYDEHGSKVLSCMAAYDEEAYIGTIPEAEYVLCVTEDVRTEYRIEEYNWLIAAEYADSLGVDVINSSVGYSYFDDDRMDYTYAALNGDVTVVTRAADIAASKGMLVVISNGNEGNDPWRYLNAPADADSVLAVGSVDADLVKARFSSFGPTADGRIKPDLVALGVWTRVIHGDNVAIANGTSFSSPLVAGLAAGFWQAFPQMTNMEVMEYLKVTASNASNPDTLTGYGVPHFARAYNRARLNEGDLVEEFIVYPNPVDGSRIIYLYSDMLMDGGLSRVRLFDLKGAELKEQLFESQPEKRPVEIDVSAFVPGTYILTCENNNKSKKSKIVIL